MEKTHLDPTRAAPLPPPGERGTVKDHRAGSTRNATSSSTGTARAGTAEPLELRSLGDFRILRRLGEGGMGAVYLGYDGRSDRQVALKVLNDNLTSNQNYIDRFYREARSGAILNHPNIVRTFGAGQDRHSGMHYLVLEYVDGPSAHALLAQHGPLSVPDVVHVGLDVARALEHAHSRNIVHRDIKPDNILTTRSGVAKLGDLGLAKRTDEASHLTAARQGFGTTAYMPYEQAMNAKYADARSDLYALGATLYHLLTGQVPFPGENHLDIVEKKNQGGFRPASSHVPGIPPVLDAILGRMLARYPRDRYQTASEVIIDLERSKLGVAVPSFADPDLAKKDPWLQACISGGEPTRLDPESTPTPGEDPDADEEWIVHYSNRSGRPFTSRLTTGDIIARLEEGTLPANAQARRPSEEKLWPLSAFEEFLPYLEAVEEQGQKTLPPEAPPLAGPTPGDWWTTVGMMTAALVGAGLVLAFLRWLMPG